MLHTTTTKMWRSICLRFQAPSQQQSPSPNQREYRLSRKEAHPSAPELPAIRSLDQDVCVRGYRLAKRAALGDALC